MSNRSLALSLGLALILSGCGATAEPSGNQTSGSNGTTNGATNGESDGSNTSDTGGEDGGGNSTDNGDNGTVCETTAEEYFLANVQTNLDICRTCHTPGSVADVDGGDQFMLSTNSSEDFANLMASWSALGGNNPTSKILIYGSGGESHTGGPQWPTDSAAYQNAAMLFALFADPSACPQ